VKVKGRRREGGREGEGWEGKVEREREGKEKVEREGMERESEGKQR
jgi:hypothetical protein